MLNSLGDNNIGDKGAEAVALGLEGNTQLEELNLSKHPNGKRRLEQDHGEGRE